MSYAGAVLSFLIPPPDEPMAAESVYDQWIELLDSIREENSVFSNWLYLTDNKHQPRVDFHNREAVIYDSKKTVREFDSSYEGIGSISFTAYGHYFDEESTDNRFSWGGRLGVFTLDVGLLKNVDWSDYWEVFANCLRKLSGVLPPFWANVAPDRYRDKAVFPHREFVGWMAVVPDVDLSEEMLFVDLAEHIPDIGTLIVTTKELFDPDNPDHINVARATEIFLAEHNLLPEWGR